MDNETQVDESVNHGFEDNYYALASFFCSCLLIIVAVFGIIGNVLSYWVFAKSSAISSIKILLAAQAVMDIVLLFIATPLFATIGMSYYSTDPNIGLVINILVVYVYPVAMIAQSATVWMTVVITCERYLAVCKPFKAMIVCTTQNAKRCLIVVVFAAIGYNICRFWEYRLSPHYELEQFLRIDSLYLEIYYNWMYFWTIFFVPLLVLIVLNGLIIRTIYVTRRQTHLHSNRQQHREYQTSIMMIVITISFLFCNVLAFLLKLLENICFNGTSPTVCEEPYYFFLIDFNNLLVEINSSIPFLVYMSFSRCFRIRLYHIFGGKYQQKKRSSVNDEFATVHNISVSTLICTLCSLLLTPFKRSKGNLRKNSSCYRSVYSHYSQVTRLHSRAETDINVTQIIMSNV